MAESYNVLVCDDEKDIVSALKIYLASDGYNIYEAYNGEEALEILHKEEIHLVLLDIMMPVLDGMQTLIKIRDFSNVPVIFLSAKSEDMDKIMGLTVGADDYITKPFNPVEVQARVKSHLRRYVKLGGTGGTGVTGKRDNVIVNGGIELNDDSKSVTVDGEPVSLTKTEYDILKLFMTNRDIVFSPENIYEKVWKDVMVGSESTVAVHIRHLREKIEINPAEPRYLKVVWGYGYKMEDFS